MSSLFTPQKLEYLNDECIVRSVDCYLLALEFGKQGDETHTRHEIPEIAVRWLYDALGQWLATPVVGRISVEDKAAELLARLLHEERAS